MVGDLGLYFGVAFAGFVSFVSPCVLPLVPPYLSYIGGTTADRMVAEGGIDRARWWRIVLAAVVFVLGFTTVFVALGAGASMAGQFLQTHKGQLGMVAGVVIIVFGLHFLGILKIPLLYREARYQGEVQGASLLGAYLLGLAFAFGWTPCIGPVLAAVLTLAAHEATLGTGVRLLLVYSLGLGIPFVLAAMAMRQFIGLLGRFRRHLGTVEKVMGVLLVVTGILFLTGSINWLGQWLLDNVPLLARIEEMATPEGLQRDIMKKGLGQ
jgi:cytochrome c-type biogenesis protein